jgi:hypothetical protein
VVIAMVPYRGTVFDISASTRRWPLVTDHVERGQPFGMPGDAGEPCTHDQPRAVQGIVSTSSYMQPQTSR